MNLVDGDITAQWWFDWLEISVPIAMKVTIG